MSNKEDSVDMNALDDLLEAERTALLNGDLAALADMLPAKEALIEALNALEANDLPQMINLDGKVRRNQLLLDGALEGIREVAAKMATLRRVRNSLETYGSDGRKRDIEVRRVPSVERRA